jgi:hypothetical protein
MNPKAHDLGGHWVDDTRITADAWGARVAGPAISLGDGGREVSGDERHTGTFVHGMFLNGIFVFFAQHHVEKVCPKVVTSYFGIVLRSSLGKLRWDEGGTACTVRTDISHRPRQGAFKWQ